MTPEKLAKFRKYSGNTKIFVAVLAYASIQNKFVISLLELQAALLLAEIGYHVRIMTNYCYLTAAKNTLIYAFLQSKATHLLMVDSDTIFVPNDIYELLEANSEVVSGTVAGRNYNWGEKRGGILCGDNPARSGTIPGSPLGFILIKRSVFEKLNNLNPRPFDLCEHKAVGYLREEMNGKFKDEYDCFAEDLRKIGVEHKTLPNVRIKKIGLEEYTI